MKLTNQNVLRPTTFNDKRHVQAVSGPQKVRWKNVIARVDAILEANKQTFVIVAATGRDPRRPSVHDVTNAKLAATIVAKQPRRRFSRKQIVALLRYEPTVQVRIDVDTRVFAKEIRRFLRDSRHPVSKDILPAPLLAFLLNQAKTARE